MAICPIIVQKKKDYERAEAEAASLAKIEEEENDEKPMPDCLNDIPCEIDKEDHVRRYLTALPTTTVHTNATSINSMDHQQNTLLT